MTKDKYYRVLISHDGGRMWGTACDRFSTKADANEYKTSKERLDPTVLGHKVKYKVVTVHERMKG